MDDRPLLIVGFASGMLPLMAGFQPAGTVVLVEEPDVVRKRGVRAEVADAPVLRELVEWEYRRPGAADEFVNVHSKLRPAAVVPVVEYAVPFAARLAERYHLPGTGVGTAELLRDKSLLRRVTEAAGIANPVSVPVSGPAELRQFMLAGPGRTVLKPANRQGSVGTMILDRTDDADAAWEACVDQDEGVLVPDRPMPVRMLAEHYLDGPEYSVEMLVRAGEPVFCNVTEKSLFPGVRPVESGHVVPADISPRLWARLTERTVAVLAAVGFGTGYAHAEWIDTGQAVYLVECAGRIAGGGIDELIERAYPVELVRHLCSLLRGEPVPDLPERARWAAAIRFLQAHAGVVSRVDGTDDALDVPGVLDCHVSVSPGDRVPVLRGSLDRVGSVLAMASTPAEAQRRAAKAARCIHITVRP